jgi:hypothetical protein
LLQVGSILAETALVPDWTMRALFIVLLAGFPVFVVLAWIFNLTATGIIRTEDIAAQPSNLTRQAAILVARISPDANTEQYSADEIQRRMRESGLWAKDFHAAAVRADDDVLIAAFRDATDALFYAVRLQEHARQLEIPTLVGLTVHTDIEAPDPLDAEYAGLADAHSRIAPVGGIVVGESVYGALSGSKFALPGGLFEKQFTIDEATGRQAFVLERQKMEALDQALRSLLITIPSGKSSSLIKVLALVFLTAFTGLLWKWLPSLQTPEPDRPQTIAVLPFEDTTGDLAVRAMVRGLSDDLFNAIAEVHGLNLVARRAARTLDHSEKSVQEIGEILNASLLLEGSPRPIPALNAGTTSSKSRASDWRKCAWNCPLQSPQN